MEHLCQYASSGSATDSDTEEIINISPKRKYQPNFFGLNDDDDDDDGGGGNDGGGGGGGGKNKHDKSKGGETASVAGTTNFWRKNLRQTASEFVVTHDGAHISLPSVSFWEGITEEEISNAEMLKEHFVKTVSDSITSIKPSQPPSSPFEEDNDNRDGEDTGKQETPPVSSTKTISDVMEASSIKPYTNKRQRLEKPVNQSYGEESLSLPVPVIDSAGKKRKLYFVHGKIAPYQSSCSNSGSSGSFSGQNQIAKKKESTLHSHVGSINRIRWCVPQYSHLLLSVADDSLVKIWNIWSQLDPCVQILRHHSSCVKDAEWSTCGHHILTCGYDRKAIVTDVETGSALQILSHREVVPCARYHPVNTNLVLTGTRDVIYSWDLRTSQEPLMYYTYKDTLGTIQDIQFSQDGEIFFSCCDIVSQDSADRSIMAWHYKTGVVLSNQIYHEKYTCTRLGQHPAENTFLAQSQGGYIALFSSKTPFKMEKSRRFEKHKLMGYKIGFDISSDGRFVSSGSSDGKVYTYHFYNGSMMKTLYTGFNVSMDIAYHPVLPSTLACCSLDGEIQIWH